MLLMPLVEPVSVITPSNPAATNASRISWVLVLLPEVLSPRSTDNKDFKNLE